MVVVTGTHDMTAASSGTSSAHSSPGAGSGAVSSGPAGMTWVSSALPIAQSFPVVRAMNRS
jgi:hypothetical protein